jgi:hypothetical protein
MRIPRIVQIGRRQSQEYFKIHSNFLRFFEAYIHLADKNGPNFARPIKRRTKTSQTAEKAENGRLWIRHLGGYAEGFSNAARACFTLRTHYELPQVGTHSSSASIPPYYSKYSSICPISSSLPQNYYDINESPVYRAHSSLPVPYSY